MIPTADELLSNLPTIIIVWTAITLCWGVYTHAMCNQVKGGDLRYSGKHVHHIYFLVLMNAVLASFLILESFFVNFMDMIIVVNIFYGTYLAATSYTLVRWWKTLKSND